MTSRVYVTSSFCLHWRCLCGRNTMYYSQHTEKKVVKIWNFFHANLCLHFESLGTKGKLIQWQRSVKRSRQLFSQFCYHFACCILCGKKLATAFDRASPLNSSHFSWASVLQQRTQFCSIQKQNLIFSSRRENSNFHNFALF